MNMLALNCNFYFYCYILKLIYSFLLNCDVYFIIFIDLCSLCMFMYVGINTIFFSAFIPPKNAEIALWTNSRVVKWGERQRGATRRSSRASSGQVRIREKKIGAPIPRVYPMFATYRGFIRFFWLTGGLSDFSRIPGIYRIFLTYRGFIGFPSKYRDLVGFLLNTEGLSDPRPKLRGFIEDRYIGSTTKNPGVYL